MSRYREQVAAALRAVAIRGPTRYAWLGRANRRLPPPIEAALEDSERRSYLVSSLRDELYRSFYCRGEPVPAGSGEPHPAAADARLVQALSDANTGHGTWQPGWTVQRVDGDHAVAATPSLRGRVPLSDCQTAGEPIRPGGSVAIRLPKELPERSPGYYTAIGDAMLDASARAFVRVYWNVTADAAPALVHELTARLNASAAPFRLKLANHPSRFDRCDAAVLYLPGPAFRTQLPMLREVAGALVTRLRPTTPAFTLEMTPGVGLAEDGPSGESFGLRRCALLADGIVRAREMRARGLAAQVDVVAARFARDAIRLDAPYLEPALAGRHVL